MKEKETIALLYRINMMFSPGDYLYVDSVSHSKIYLHAEGLKLRVSWPSIEFCLFGADRRIPGCKYTPIFEMVCSDWKYYPDASAFAERNQWMKPYVGCASMEELALKMSAMAQ